MNFRINIVKYSSIFSIVILSLLIVFGSNSYSTESNDMDYEVTVVKVAPNNSSNSARTNVYFTAEDGTFTNKSYTCNNHELAVVLFALANNSELHVNMNLSGIITGVYMVML